MTQESPSQPVTRRPFCRDPLRDFVWASGIQGLVVVAWGLSGFFFVAEEVLLFGALVLVKHRVPVPCNEAS